MSRRKNNYDVLPDITITKVEDACVNDNSNIDDYSDGERIDECIDKPIQAICEENNVKKHKECKIIKFISKSKSKAIINFDGKGLIVNIGDDLLTTCDTVGIEYIGEIGKSDFSYEVVSS